MAFWRQKVDSDRALQEVERLRQRRRLRAWAASSGMIRVEGELDPETGETVLTALGAVQDTWARRRGTGDPRTPDQRRADALGELARSWLDSKDRPTVGGERPHVTVVVDIEALQGKTGHRAEQGHTGPVHPQVARLLACDASIGRVITRGRSEPLQVG